MTRIGAVCRFYSDLVELAPSRFTQTREHAEWRERAIEWGDMHVDSYGNLVVGRDA